ncbi:MAG: hypothetical protein ACREJ8_03455, partial [Candidatus Methylomirabilales bacterium]
MPDKSPGEEKEPSFRVTDRRRVGAEGPRETAEARPDPQSPEAEASPPEDLALPDLVRLFVAEL